MSTINGTISGVTLLRAKGDRKSYLVSARFAAYTGASDSGQLQAVGVAIAAKTRNGKTNTIRSAACVGAGSDTAAQAVFTGAVTVSTDDLTFNLTNAAGTELTSATACTGVEFVVIVDES